MNLQIIQQICKGFKQIPKNESDQEKIYYLFYKSENYRGKKISTIPPNQKYRIAELIFMKCWDIYSYMKDTNKLLDKLKIKDCNSFEKKQIEKFINTAIITGNLDGSQKYILELIDRDKAISTSITRIEQYSQAIITFFESKLTSK